MEKDEIMVYYVEYKNELFVKDIKLILSCQEISMYV